jgi:hypothetical protein
MFLRNVGSYKSYTGYLPEYGILPDISLQVTLYSTCSLLYDEHLAHSIQN